MIPLKLTLKNFLSYGPDEQSVDFSPYALMCLSGKNGHGKSSLLDAITWAVWGCARKIGAQAKSDEGLVHSGERQMVVHFEFFANGQTYRIRREFFKSYGKAISQLDFEVLDKSSDSFVALTDKTIRATQEAIERVVGVDFVTFCNTSFLRQGQSNEFSKRSPKERKDIIATILGLDRFDACASRALESARERSQKQKTIQPLVVQAQQLAAGRPDIEQQMVQTINKLSDLEKELKELEGQVQQAVVVEKEVALAEQQVIATHQEIIQLQHVRQAVAVDCAQLAQQWRTMHHKLVFAPHAGNDLMEQRALLVAQETEWRTKQHKEIEFRMQYAALEKQLLTVEHLEKQLIEWDKTIELITKDVSACVEKKQKFIEQLTQRSADVEQHTFLTRQFEKRKAFYHSCVSRRTMLLAQIKETTERSELVAQVESPACPMCEQLLTVKRKQFLLAQLSKKDQLLTRRCVRLTSIARALKELLVGQHNLLKELDIRLAHYVKIEHEVVSLAAEEVRLVRERELATEKKKEIEHLRAQIPSSLHEEIKKVSDLLLQTTYDAQQHQAVSKELERVMDLLNVVQESGQLSRQAAQIRFAVKQQWIQSRQMAQSLRLKEREIVRAESAIANNKELLSTLAQKRAVFAVRTHEKMEAVQLKGTLSARLEHCVAAIEQQAGYEKELALIAQEQHEYELLAQAYGKNGIQALLIEQILPEIEREANELLSRLTDNQMQLFIESLRDLKSGGVRETLDIQISDPAGVRPYEMFSGGEAFRIDFVLRIAISKLLARRAGTKLQTLFIDEGFGSQDEEALSRLTDVLFAIQDDFEKIIIVSHLERLKDNFPVHLIVEKRAGGSVVSVEERG